MSDKTKIQAYDQAYRDIQAYQEIVDCGNPWFVEWFYSNRSDEETIQQRLSQLFEEQRINSESGRWDENLETDIKTMNALLEIRRIQERLRALETGGHDDPGGVSLV